MHMSVEVEKCCWPHTAGNGAPPTVQGKEVTRTERRKEESGREEEKH